MYYGGYHFTFRFIPESGTAWHHDGITTGGILYVNDSLNYVIHVDSSTELTLNWMHEIAVRVRNKCPSCPTC